MPDFVDLIEFVKAETSLHSYSHKTHVNAPKKANKTQKHNATVDWNEGKADDGSNRPDLVTSHNDGDCFLVMMSGWPCVLEENRHLPS